MKKLGIVTTGRAEYGLLSPIIKALRCHESDVFHADLIVSGTHLSEKYGMTIEEIQEDGVRIDHEIPVTVNTASPVDIARNQGEVLVRMTDLFVREKYDGLLILGDRYEMLAVATAALNTRTPIFHISGGDVSEGAIDDSIRHAITKMSYLHFTTNEQSRKRVIQLGEDPRRVFNTGSTSIDNVLHVASLSKREAMESVGIINECYAVCTYHPVTLDPEDEESQIKAFLDAIRAFPTIDFIVTKSNADLGGDRINRILEDNQPQISNMYVFSSLGIKRYLSLMKYAQFVLGNSSSGIVETPAFHIPTVNIGDRQKGRLQAESVINCGTDSGAIIHAIQKAVSPEMKAFCKNIDSPYGDGCSAKRVTEKIMEIINTDIDLKKQFYDVGFDI